jgi:lipoprotein-anchoring transpeptidase ErfK/SrfK
VTRNASGARTGHDRFHGQGLGAHQAGRRAIRAAIAAILALGILALGAGPALAKSSKPHPHNVAALPALSVVAAAVGPQVAVFDRPGAPAPQRTLTNPTNTKGQLVLLVDQVSNGWAKVLLPVRPNHSTGWIRVRDVTMSVDPYRIVVRLKSHQLGLYLLNKPMLRAPVGIGTKDTPTPDGRYYLTQLFRPPNPDGAYGPFAYSLSGFSNVLQTFEGGDAIIGLHGTNQPQLVGHDVSHGCIRMTNDVITKLARILPLGTPVQIVAT